MWSTLTSQSVRYKGLIAKIQSYGIHGTLHSEMADQRVINGKSSGGAMSSVVFRKC